MRRYFLLNWEILQNTCKYCQYFDRSKKRHDRAKIGLVGQHDRPPFKNYFEPVITMRKFTDGFPFLSHMSMGSAWWPFGPRSYATKLKNKNNYVTIIILIIQIYQLSHSALTKATVVRVKHDPLRIISQVNQSKT